ncbi:Hypothetical predicted protein, partial [Pelobates cultripes]
CLVMPDNSQEVAQPQSEILIRCIGAAKTTPRAFSPRTEHFNNTLRMCSLSLSGQCNDHLPRYNFIPPNYVKTEAL